MLNKGQQFVGAGFKPARFENKILRFGICYKTNP